MNIVFSIPIHERADVVLDQIVNINYYNKGCNIVLHISKDFNWKDSLITKTEFLKIINSMDFVIVNPENLRSGLFDIIQCHISNFNYIKDKIDFKYFCMDSSNSMFVKPGLLDYISKYELGNSFTKEENILNWHHLKIAHMDVELKNLMKNEGLKEIIGSQIEGSFYKKNIFENIQYIICKYFDFNDINLTYAREEVYFSTVSQKFINKKQILKDCYTYIDWNDELKITIDKINRVRINNRFYNVKRINRDMKDPIRQYLAKEIDSKKILEKYDLNGNISRRLYYG